MKQGFGILLLVIMCAVFVRPISPFVQYILNYDQIANVFCVNRDIPAMNCKGKCYLKDLLAKVLDEERPEEKRNTNLSFEQLLKFYIQPEETVVSIPNTSYSMNLWETSNFYSDQTVKPPTPPPKV